MELQGGDFRFKAIVAVGKDAMFRGCLLELFHRRGDIGIVRDGGLGLLRRL